MNASEMLYQFHATFEGVEYEAYVDSVGVKTIGIGHTGPDVEVGMTWTPEQVYKAWEVDIQEAEDLANKWLDGAVVSQELFDAIVDIAFNTGTKPRTMISYAQAGNEDAAIHELPRWVYAGGKVLLGLVKRRLAMYVYCHGGDWREVAECPLTSKNLDDFNNIIEHYGFEVVKDPDANFAIEEL